MLRLRASTLVVGADRIVRTAGDGVDPDGLAATLDRAGASAQVSAQGEVHDVEPDPAVGA
jgi:hypothetical protein